MILIADRNGQLGNRLYTFANFIGWCLEHGSRVANPGFRDYADYFEGTFADPWCRFPVQSAHAVDAVTRRIAFPIIFFLARQGRGFNLRTPWLSTRNNRGGDFLLDANSDRLLASKLTVVRGWGYWDNGNLKKHRDAIRSYFTPRPHHLKNISECITRARSRCDVLVGVHIRRGDYMNHLGGQYFYEHAVYRNIMEKVRTLFGQKTVGFLVCSNEPVNEDFLQGLNAQVGPNHPVEDMYAFASCDYLVGPPSTFTMWASYFGAVPLLQINSPSAALMPRLDEFHVF